MQMNINSPKNVKKSEKIEFNLKRILTIFEIFFFDSNSDDPPAAAQLRRGQDASVAT